MGSLFDLNNVQLYFPLYECFGSDWIGSAQRLSSDESIEVDGSEMQVFDVGGRTLF